MRGCPCCMRGFPSYVCAGVLVVCAGFLLCMRRCPCCMRGCPCCMRGFPSLHAQVSLLYTRVSFFVCVGVLVVCAGALVVCAGLLVVCALVQCTPLFCMLPSRLRLVTCARLALRERAGVHEGDQVDEKDHVRGGARPAPAHPYVAHHRQAPGPFLQLPKPLCWPDGQLS